MIELKGITKKYGCISVVDNVSFRILSGEIIGYIGPNGAGKTTSIRMLAGLLRPSKGEIWNENQPINSDLYSYKKRIGYVPEESEVYPHMSGLDYLLLVGRLRYVPEKELNTKARDIIHLFGLEHDQHAALSSYSKGMKKKILFSAALLHNPDILLLDEPLSGLDVISALIIKDIICMLAKMGKMILFSSHILEVTENICSRVIILNQGRIVANDSVTNLQRLMQLPNLTDVFSKLVAHEDTRTTASHIVKIITE